MELEKLRDVDTRLEAEAQAEYEVARAQKITDAQVDKFATQTEVMPKSGPHSGGMEDILSGKSSIEELRTEVTERMVPLSEKVAEYSKLYRDTVMVGLSDPDKSWKALMKSGLKLSDILKERRIGSADDADFGIRTRVERYISGTNLARLRTLIKDHLCEPDKPSDFVKNYKLSDFLTLIPGLDARQVGVWNQFKSVKTD